MRCERLKDFQLGFLKKAQNHILGILSHYAGKSENNTKAILPKRRVSLADQDVGDETREKLVYRIQTAGGARNREC